MDEKSSHGEVHEFSNTQQPETIILLMENCLNWIILDWLKYFDVHWSVIDF